MLQCFHNSLYNVFLLVLAQYPNLAIVPNLATVSYQHQHLSVVSRKLNQLAFYVF